jgi:hypothetical protein
MAEDDLSPANRGSDPPSFDFDEDAISTLLDTFVETQTGPQAKRSVRSSSTRRATRRFLSSATPPKRRAGAWSCSRGWRNTPWVRREHGC